MLSFFNQGWVGIVSGILISLVIFLASRRRAVPKAAISSSHELTWNNVPGLPKGFELNFNGKQIPRISRGLCRFWNDGSDTLSGELVPLNDKLRLVIPDGEFLLAGTPKVSNAINQCEAQIDETDRRIVHFKFDYLDPKDGAVIGFLHSSTTAIPKLMGTIKGHKIKISEDFRNAQGQFLGPKARRIFKFLPVGLIIVGAMFVITAALPERYLTFETQRTATDAAPLTQAKPHLDRTVFLIVGATYIIGAGVIFWTTRRKHPKSLDFGKAISPVKKK